jgi:UDP-galactopyranose mutase
MPKVVVVGGGLGGLASAVRLAKLGHDVTLLEASGSLGGALGAVHEEGFTWDAGATYTLLPAALRDLFRKSGRPLEAELGAELEPLEVIREHRFRDRSAVRVPGGSRGAQIAAFDELGKGLGEAWARHVDTYAPVWDVLRRNYVEAPWDPADPGPELSALFRTRETLHKRLRRDLRDDRLALVAAHPLVAEGHDPRNVPAWAGVPNYLEQSFGAWQVPGGVGRIAELLTARLETRGVTVVTGAEASDVVVRDGTAVGVATADGAHDADVVVVAIDPRRLPALARYVERTMPAIPPVVAHLGLEGEAPDLPPELVIHDEPLLVVRTGGTAPQGHSTLTIQGRGKIAEDLADALARHKIDVREQVVVRVDRSPLDQVELWRGSPVGVLWQGRGTLTQRIGPRTPVPGVYVAGAHGAPGAGIPYVAQSAALVAQLVGPAG